MLLTDTVGFVRKLPHQLVEAFQSTLEVVADADLLVHVVDASAPDPEAQIDAVRDGARARSAPATCPSCSCSTRPTSRPTRQAPRRAAPGLGRASRRRPARASTTCSRTIGDRLRALTTVVELVVPVRPRRRARRAAPRGRGARRVARRRRACGCGPGSTRPRVGRFAEFVVERRDDPSRLRPAAVPLRPARRARRRSPSATTAACVDLSVGTPCDPPPDVGASTRSAHVGRRARLPARRSAAPALPRGGARVDRAGASASTSTAPRSRRASAPRSSSAALPQWLHLRDPTATPCSTRRSATRPTRWARCSPAAARCRCRSTTTGSSTSTRSTRPTPRARCASGSTRRATPPARSTTSARRRRGAARTASRCSATSATSSSPGTAPPRTILEHGTDGVVAVHSLSKRSNLAGVRAGFYAGDPDLVQLPRRGAQARRVHGAGAGAGGRRRGARRRRARRGAARSLPRASGTDREAARRLVGRRGLTARRAASTCGCRRPTATPGRSRVRSPKPRARWSARRVLRRARPRAARGGATRRPHRARRSRRLERVTLG